MSRRPRFRPFLVPVFLFLILLRAQAADPGAAAEELRIGAWNIEQLGSPDHRSRPATNIAQHPADVARHIVKARVDVLALEEIGDTDGVDATRSSATLDATIAILNQLEGEDWTYLLFPKKDPTQTYQLTGVAWNRKRVRRVGEPWKIPVVDDPSDPFDTWQRQPHALKLSAGKGKTDLVLIPVHMKSNVGGEVTKQQRAAEAKALVEQIPAIRRHFGDADIVILGDLNCLSGDEPGVTRYTDAGLVDLNRDDAPTTWKGGFYEPAPFDRILVPGGQPEFEACRLEVLTPRSNAAHVRHKRLLSDHHLVTTVVRIMADDDQIADDTGSASAVVRIVRLVPNPVGIDDEAESVTIRNLGREPVELDGWRLKDDDDPDLSWPLRGKLRAGEEAIFVRPNSGIQLANRGDTVRLVDPAGKVVHEVTYEGPVEAGQVIAP